MFLNYTKKNLQISVQLHARIYFCLCCNFFADEAGLSIGQSRYLPQGAQTIRGPQGPRFSRWQLVCGNLINCQFGMMSALRELLHILSLTGASCRDGGVRRPVGWSTTSIQTEISRPPLDGLSRSLLRLSCSLQDDLQWRWWSTVLSFGAIISPK